MSIVVALAAAAVAGFVAAFAATRLIPGSPLARTNYRGLRIVTGLGVAPLAGLFAGVGVLAFASEIREALAQPGSWFLPVAAAGGFGVLGLFDDIASAASPGGARGFRGHTLALSKGSLTTGGLKLAAGSALAFALASPVTEGFAFALAGGAVIALSANLLNAFDLRPGRASKAFLAGAVPLAVMAGPIRGVVCAAAGAIVAFLPFDVRERAMLGDAGANAFGAFLGACAVILAGKQTLLIVLIVLAILQTLAETVTLSRLIASLPPLRALDRLGRASEVGVDAEGAA